MRTVPPNILFIIWDACRLDYAREHAPNLAELAENNLWFENAITAGANSLPSHMSMVTGEYPHEHKTFSRGDSMDRTPLLSELGDRGYSRYGVSANGFASPKYGFDIHFDEFYNTQGQMVFPEGFDVHRYARRVREEQGSFSPGSIDRSELLTAVLRHDHPIKGLVNVASAALSEYVTRHETLQRVPHRRFSRYSEFCYSPEKNTECIQDLLRSTDDDTPFFLFSNYMDAHHPYAPPARQQRRYIGERLSFRELSRYADRTHPLNYLTMRQSGQEIDEETIETVRALYAGEVRTADEHLGRVLNSLEESGLRDETLIVVTADHGENLGDRDLMGDTRFGHICSVSDELLRVPLVIAHPELEGRTVDEHVSLRDLYSLLTAPDTLLNSAGADIGPLAAENGKVSGQLPGASSDALLERHPEIADLLRRHMVATYADGWKIVATSADEPRAWYEGEEHPIEEAPEDAVDTATRQLAALISAGGEGRRLSEDEQAHLEALGYL